MAFNCLVIWYGVGDKVAITLEEKIFKVTSVQYTKDYQRSFTNLTMATMNKLDKTIPIL